MGEGGRKGEEEGGGKKISRITTSLLLDKFVNIF